MTYAFLKPRGMVEPVLGVDGLGDYDTNRVQAEISRDVARDILTQYTDDLSMSLDDAQRALRKGEAWARDNKGKLEAYRAANGDKAETTPELALMMRQEDAQELIKAAYVTSAVGVAPQISGAALEASVRGEINITPAELQSDLSRRTNSLQSFQDMDVPGASGKSILAEIFNPKPQTLNGVGALGVGVIAILVIGAVVALIGLAFVISQCLVDYWKIQQMGQLCAKAQSSGDEKTLSQCTKSLKPTDTTQTYDAIIKAIENSAQVLGIAAIAAAGLYLYMISPKPAQIER